MSLGLDFWRKFSRETPLSYISDRNLGVSLLLYNAIFLRRFDHSVSRLLLKMFVTCIIVIALTAGPHTKHH